MERPSEDGMERPAFRPAGRSLMKAFVLVAVTLLLCVDQLAARQAQTPAPTAPAPGRGRGAQAPPPPTLTCTSKATETDNKVPPALAKEGFTAIFNGKDLTGWQALIDVGTLRAGSGLNPADIANLTPADRA